MTKDRWDAEQSARKDGGPAFPRPASTGMMLRDWFAGQALAGWSETHHGMAYEVRMAEGTGSIAESMAAAAYKIADAMLKARDA